MVGLRILFLSTRVARPSFRYRVQQMLPFFEDAGHHCTVRFFPRNLLMRILLYRNLPAFDAVFIQKRLLSLVELKLVRRWSRRLIFDLDDPLVFDRYGQVDHRRHHRFAAMARSTDLVVCGNQYLASQATRLGGRATIIPTAVDTERFQPRHSPRNLPVTTIGWTGSRSSVRYLNRLLPLLVKVSPRIELKIVADTIEGLDITRLGSVPCRFVPWTAETEVQETAEFDIGLMPLTDDERARGKCGCKALQYMALGIPAVCSPVGVNRDIIRHGHNGYLPTTDEEWITTLRSLVDAPDLRDQIGQAGRATVEDRFSLQMIARTMITTIERAAC